MPGVNSLAVEEFERQLIAKVDLVATSSRLLRDLLEEHHTNVRYLPHGVDYDLFRRALSSATGSCDTATTHAKVVSLVGMIGEHIDFSLLDMLFQEIPEAEFQIIGPIDQKYEKFLARRNVVCFGARPHESIPEFLAHANVCIVPYITNDRIRYANSTKVREYLAAGRPVVATTQPGVSDINGQIDVCDSHEDFLQAVRRRLTNEPDHQSISTSMRRETWGDRAVTLARWMDEFDS